MSNRPGGRAHPLQAPQAASPRAGPDAAPGDGSPWGGSYLKELFWDEEVREVEGWGRERGRL